MPDYLPDVVMVAILLIVPVLGGVIGFIAAGGLGLSFIEDENEQAD